MPSKITTSMSPSSRIAALAALLAALALPTAADAQGAAGDNCASPIAAVLGANAVDTTLATDSSQGYDDAECPFGGLGFMAKDIWLAYTPSQTGLLTVSACNTIDWDSDLVIYTGSCAALSQVACSGDAFGCVFTSAVFDLPVTIGQSILIRLGGWGSTDAGTGTLSLSFAAPGQQFRRGDCNASGSAPDISDAVRLLEILFTGQGPAVCDDACDGNDDGAMNIADAVYGLAYLFSGGLPPPAPGPTACGTDPTLDMLGCASPAGCP